MCSRFVVVSPFAPKKLARMLLSMPVIRQPRAPRNSTASEPMRPHEPVTMAFFKIGLR